jgi:NADH:ubiquinone oxidoreductase subunit 6 (subunit J)
MMWGLAAGLFVSFAAAFAAVILGRNLTRSIFSAAISIAALSFVLVSMDAGFAALCAITIGALLLATLQLFGWMLVDVDRDHLPPTDRATWFARSLAFILLGGGLALFAVHLVDTSSLMLSRPAASTDAANLGLRFFGVWRDLATLAGLTLAAGLLAALMLMRGEGEGR